MRAADTAGDALPRDVARLSAVGGARPGADRDAEDLSAGVLSWGGSGREGLDEIASIIDQLRQLGEAQAATVRIETVVEFIDRDSRARSDDSQARRAEPSVRTMMLTTLVLAVAVAAFRLYDIYVDPVTARPATVTAAR